jgi:cysteine synthase A
MDTIFTNLFGSNPMAGPKIADNICDLIGRTPMVRLNKLNKDANVVANIVLKLESMEPCSSVKDRLAKGMIEGAEARGEITPGQTVLVEPTSGNTGIGMAMVAAVKGYEMILTMPATMSMERRVMLKALGARVVLTPGDKGVKGAIAKAEEIVESLGGRGKILGQFSNPDNIRIHRETTGPEIWYQTDGAVEAIVGGVGTGGTISGSAEYLRSVKPDMKVIAVEPVESDVLSGGTPGPHKIQGIGAGFIPGVYSAPLEDIVVYSNAVSSVKDTFNIR